MAVPGYQCQGCWATFMLEQSDGLPENPEFKCPTCQGTNVKKVDLPESWVNRVRGGIRFG